MMAVGRVAGGSRGTSHRGQILWKTKKRARWAKGKGRFSTGKVGQGRDNGGTTPKRKQRQRG